MQIELKELMIFASGVLTFLLGWWVKSSGLIFKAGEKIGEDKTNLSSLFKKVDHMEQNLETFKKTVNVEMNQRITDLTKNLTKSIEHVQSDVAELKKYQEARTVASAQAEKDIAILNVTVNALKENVSAIKESVEKGHESLHKSLQSLTDTVVNTLAKK